MNIENKSGASHLVGLGIIPPEEVIHTVRWVQDELYFHHGVRKSRQDPHITIKSPHHVDHIDPYLDFVESLVRQMDSFFLKISGISQFNDEVIYFSLEHNPLLIKTHEYILENICYKFKSAPDPLEGKLWIPHISLARTSDQNTFKKATAFLQNIRPQYEWEISTIGVFHYNETEGWKIIKMIPLNA